MHVIEQAVPAAAPIPGIAHATWAGAAEGLSQLSVWRQSIAPGGATPPHHHDCDEVVLCLAGAGDLHIGGGVQRFHAGQTLVIPRGQAHQIVNSGDAAIECIGVFGASPVGVFLPDGQALELPWRT